MFIFVWAGVLCAMSVFLSFTVFCFVLFCIVLPWFLLPAVWRIKLVKTDGGNQSNPPQEYRGNLTTQRPRRNSLRQFNPQQIEVMEFGFKPTENAGPENHAWPDRSKGGKCESESKPPDFNGGKWWTGKWQNERRKLRGILFFGRLRIQRGP